MTKDVKQGKYAKTLLAVFNKKFAEDLTEVSFTQDDIREAAKELGFEFRNFPDLNYYLRSRAKSLPREIGDKGFSTIEITGRGIYKLTKTENLVTLPEKFKSLPISFKNIPKVIRDLLRADEQSLLSAIKYANLLDLFFGFECFHLQGHLRTTGSLGQQIEADDVYIGMIKKDTRCVIPIEAKGVNEKIGLSQIKSTVNAVLMKLPGMPVVPLAVQLKGDGLIHVLEFLAEIDGENVLGVSLKKFVAFEPDIQLPNWPKINPSRLL